MLCNNVGCTGSTLDKVGGGKQFSELIPTMRLDLGTGAPYLCTPRLGSYDTSTRGDWCRERANWVSRDRANGDCKVGIAFPSGSE